MKSDLNSERQPGIHVSALISCNTITQAKKSSRITEILYLIRDPAGLIFYYWTIYGSRFCILFKLIASVEVLCRSADVVGCRIPATPQAIRPALKVMIKR